jgi:hypothetical protein
MDRRGFLVGGAAMTALAPRALADVDDLRTAAREAWLYGLPLVQSARVRAAAIGISPRLGTPGFGEFAHMRSPADPQMRLFSAPEADVLYSSAWIFLPAGGEAKIGVPAAGGRYVCLTLADMYGNVLHTTEGKDVRDEGRELNLVGPPARVGVGDVKVTAPPMPRLGHLIHTRQRWVWALARVHLEGPGDLAAAHAFQDGLSVRVKPTAPTPAPSVALDAPWGDYFYAVQQLIEENPPPAVETDYFRRLAALQLGMQGGFEKARFADADTSQILAGVAEAQDLARGPRASDAAAGWVWPDPGIGDFGLDFLARARSALSQPTAPPSTAVLSLRAVAPNGALSFSGAGPWRLVLPGPAPAAGFWSLTLYEVRPDGQLFLGDTPQRRYALGGWTPGLRRRRDGAIEIWIGRSPPDGAPASNWLPAPPRGSFALILRAYAPAAALTDRSYRPPPVEPFG